MAIRTDDDLKEIINNVIKEVVDAIGERAKKLLQEHINVDTYGINKTNTGKPTINKSYLDGTGTPSYEFRDLAWDINKFKEGLNTYAISLFYDGDKMSPPSSSSPYLHGNNYTGEDRRNELANILNVSGIASNEDMNSMKIRSPFWDNFEEDLKQKLGKWLYTEFNNRGLAIPSLKNARFG